MGVDDLAVGVQLAWLHAAESKADARRISGNFVPEDTVTLVG
jgi:hypothetical protein